MGLLYIQITTSSRSFTNGLLEIEPPFENSIQSVLFELNVR
ncbi:hypothetical protein TERTU_0720 [Teredinibacter turnerae T7901]|uniref:Uncharacterized protein n=1 Tax=Teredinibacter turnerae (strain ATCC 39867 / T7901) TaxID=377629 RepID=C5BNY3_TERTT|nr:hypothetical protein TERTU_0720 [Teredinibacter turnerae T7901]